MVRPGIEIEYKPLAKPLSLHFMDAFKAYRVVEVNGRISDYASVGDIVVAIPRNPSGTGNKMAFNCTKNCTIEEKGVGDFLCVRAFNVRSITLAFDDDDGPS